MLQLISALPVGGAERLLVDVVQAAVARSNIPQVVAIMNDLVDDDLLAALRATGAPVYRLGRRPGDRSPRHLVRLLAIVRKHRARVIHAHNWGSKWWGMLCKLADPRLRLVYSVHDTGTVSRYGPAARLAFRTFVDRTIAVSEASAAECRSVGVERVAVVPNGVPLDRFAWREPPPMPVRPRIVHVGRLTPAVKGQDVLIRAVRLCRDAGLDVQCDLVGSPVDDDAGALAELNELVGTLDLQADVRIWTNRTDIPDVLRSADVFALPSRREGFGLAAVEAMATGVPVVATDVGGLREFLTDGQNALVCRVGDPGDLAEKVITLVREPRLRSALAAAGRKTASGFDVETVCDRYCEIYRGLIPR